MLVKLTWNCHFNDDVSLLRSFTIPCVWESRISAVKFYKLQGENHTSGSLSRGGSSLNNDGDTELSRFNSLSLCSFTSSPASWLSNRTLLTFVDDSERSSESWNLPAGWTGRSLWGELLWILLLIFERLATCLAVMELAALRTSPGVMRIQKEGRHCQWSGKIVSHIFNQYWKRLWIWKANSRTTPSTSYWVVL